MLLSLHIRDFAIIDELELELAPGMTTLTGETGAGKSILLDALGLLLGDRADTGSVRHGALRTDISASFDISHIPAATDWLTEQELACGDECQLRRVVLREGRSRAYINGSSVPLQSLRTLGESLVDIHGQHEHQSLMRRDMQRQLLDHHGGHHDLLDTLAAIQLEFRQVRQDIQAIVGSDQDRDSRLEFLRFQLSELDDLAPGEGEVESLHEELRRLSHAGQLIESCGTHIDHLYDNEHSAQSLLGHAVADLEPLTTIDPALQEAGELINSALIQLEEGVERLRACRDTLELDPQRLQWVEQRLDALHKVARKHRIEAETLPSFQQRLGDELERLQQADAQLESLQQRRQQLIERYEKSADQLHRRRAKTAAQLSLQVSEAMQTLGMAGGTFTIEVNKTESGELPAHGRDRIEFMVSANPGQPSRPLARIASGGELSRISLAIQVIASRDTSVASLIFDEVDSGIGGGVAEIVGQQLRRLGRHHQVLCVTHLPQVAAQANQHLQITKMTGDHTTRTRIRNLSDDDRIEEIARMLGGQKITASTREHAREMLACVDPGKRTSPGRKKGQGLFTPSE